MPDARGVSAELPETGERFEGLLPPVVTARPSHPQACCRGVTLDDYVAAGTMTADQAVLLREAVATRKNILVAGGTGTGKTTLTNALLAEIAGTSDRVVLIEDTRELQCRAPNLVAMRTKDGVASLSDLVRSSLRLRPDRIPIGEVRGAEALDLLKAWGTGHPGGIGTIHAGTALGALRRLEQLIQEAVVTVPKALLAETIDLVAVLRGPRQRTPPLRTRQPSPVSIPPPSITASCPPGRAANPCFLESRHDPFVCCRPSRPPSPRDFVAITVISLAFAPAAYASGSSMPWETPLNSILQSVQGPVAKIISVIIITVTGLTPPPSGGHVRRFPPADPNRVRAVDRLPPHPASSSLSFPSRRGAALMAALLDPDVPGFFAPVHRSLSDPMLMGGAPPHGRHRQRYAGGRHRAGLRLWIPGALMWAVGHTAAVWPPSAIRSSSTWCVGHLRYPPYFGV